MGRVGLAMAKPPSLAELSAHPDKIRSLTITAEIGR
jgi:hypothetical protein